MAHHRWLLQGPTHPGCLPNPHTAAHFTTQLKVGEDVIPAGTPETEMGAVREENKELCKGLVQDLIRHLELPLSSRLIHILSQ